MDTDQRTYREGMREHPIVAETEAMVSADNAMVNEALAKWEKARAEEAILSAKIKAIMDKPTTEPRKPLLSDEEIFSLIPTRFDAVHPMPNGMSMQGCRAVRAFYENLIASGELVIRNKCKDCGNLWTPTFITKDRCPGCGSRIVP